MRVAICDDNPEENVHYAAFTEAVGKERGLNLTITIYENATQLLFSLDDSATEPDIILLDVFMPKINGIDAGRAIRAKGFGGIIIYLTRSAEYAIPAYDVEAFSYVLKDEGETEERLSRVLENAIDRIQSRASKRILLNNISEHRNIPIDTITYFESDRHIIRVHYGADATFDFISSITKMENRLLPYGFIRIQRSYLVNRMAIERYNAKQVRLFDGTRLPIGRGHYPALCETMESIGNMGTDDSAETGQDVSQM